MADYQTVASTPLTVLLSDSRSATKRTVPVLGGSLIINFVFYGNNQEKGYNLVVLNVLE